MDPGGAAQGWSAKVGRGQVTSDGTQTELDQDAAPSNATVVEVRGALPHRNLVERPLLIVTGLLTAGLVGWVLWACQFGFDLTDESFYLLWLRSPDEYPLSTTQFGFVYHPLYVLLQGEIVWLRIVNLLIIFGLSWWLMFRIVRSAPGDKSDTAGAAVVSAGLASGGLAIVSLWLPTPNYNALNLTGLLLAAIGLSYVWAPARWPFVGWLLIGVGGWIVFMARPPSAVFLGVVVLVFVIVTRRFQWAGALLAAGLFAVLLLMSALVIDGSPVAFGARLTEGVAQLELLDAGYSFFRSIGDLLDTLLLRSIYPEASTQLVLIGVAAAAALGGVLAFGSRVVWRLAAGLTALLLAALCAFVLAGSTAASQPLDGQLTLILLSPMLAGLAVAVAAAAARRRPPESPTLVAAALCFLLPFAFAFSTNNPAVMVAPWAGVFWVAGAAALVSAAAPRHRRVATLLPIALATLLVVAIVMRAGMLVPYRQDTPLTQQGSPVAVNPVGSANLLAGPETAKYVADLRAVAQGSGFPAGTALIDLSGGTPGAAYVLGARAPGQPWLAGAYPGSRRFSEQVLGRVACADLARAWVLSEPGGEREIPAAVLLALGADLRRDYRSAGTVVARTGATQTLHRPTRDPAVAEAACAAARR